MPTQRIGASLELVYEIEITLLDTDPAIWRRVAVPGNITLGDLHAIVQIAMGWDDAHLHQFTACGSRKSSGRRLPRERSPLGLRGLMGGRPSGERMFVDRTVADVEGEDERGVTLREVCAKPKSQLLYEYDFGDGWKHRIEVLQVCMPKPGVRYPICVDGRRACPPEDCGGAWGYAELVEAMGDPKAARYEELIEWLGGPFDPEAFDLTAVNKALARWRRHVASAGATRQADQEG